MPLFLLGTDISSYITKGQSPEIEKKLITIPPDRVCVSTIIRAEILHDLKGLSKRHRLHVAVYQFLRIVNVLAWDAADHYADIRHQLTKQEQVIGEMDMMIASHALAINDTLVTNNIKHFERIEAPLAIENWTLNS